EEFILKTNKKILEEMSYELEDSSGESGKEMLNIFEDNKDL
ncbi:10692_t:CDS:2, partial [Funneliformis mosseae]